MRPRTLRSVISILPAFVFALLFCPAGLRAQSGDQNFPTPVTVNEISGTIEARDVGDSRRTTYYYTFDGGQGDLFINIVTNNLTADIDVFTAAGLRPITKVVVYADISESETGRVIYLRKREKLLLRVQGRTPNDDPATFHLKFAGSFIAAVPTDDQRPALPEIARNSNVNSVGTIVRTEPPEPKVEKDEGAVSVPTTPVEPVEIAKNDDEIETAGDGRVEIPTQVPIRKQADKPAEKEPAEVVAAAGAEIEKRPAPDKTDADQPKAESGTEARSIPQVIVTDTLPSPAPEKPKANNAADREVVADKEETPSETDKERKKTKAEALASIKLVVIFKDGGRIERPMSDVLRFTVDQGILTIITKNGSIGRYSLLDIERTVIE